MPKGQEGRPEKASSTEIWDLRAAPAGYHNVSGIVVCTNGGEH
jgi:hypothetical protein